MQRVLVIGSGGAGKSAFAVRLGRATGLPVIHLDAVYWQPEWQEPSKDAWAAMVTQLLSGKDWIMDGNYGGTMEQRLAACDTVVFLDMPRLLCIWRVLKRFVQYRGRTRPDLTPGCPEQLTWEFLSWIWTYPAQRRPRVLARLARLAPGQQALIFHSAREVDAFFDSLRGP
jgi:adenylate kinase family enzyme